MKPVEQMKDEEINRIPRQKVHIGEKLRACHECLALYRVSVTGDSKICEKCLNNKSNKGE